MFLYLIKRLLRSVITLFIILTVVFVLVRQMPISGYFPNYEKMSEAQIKNGLHEMKLDLPMHEQLFYFYRNLLTTGDLGMSRIYRNNVPVAEILAPKIPISIKLGSLSLLVALLFGLPLGVIMARNKGKFLDQLGTGYIVVIEAVPAAVYYLFIQLFGTELLGMPLINSPGTFTTSGNTAAWILPVLSMSLGNTAYYAMWIRRYVVDESRKDYVTLARMKGMSSGKILSRHVFRNAFVPMIQYIPTSFLNTVIGSIYIESLYGVPGMGGLLVDVVKRQDNAMVLGIVLLYACVGIIGLIFGDVLMVMLDPRISLTKRGGNR